MRVVKEFSSYNPRRYSRPWIAKVSNWPIGDGATLEFGYNVSDRLCEIDAPVGAIVRWGQRDNRGNNTVSAWGEVQTDGSVLEIGAEEARERWLAAHAQALPIAHQEATPKPEIFAEDQLAEWAAAADENTEIGRITLRLIAAVEAYQRGGESR